MIQSIVGVVQKLKKLLLSNLVGVVVILVTLTAANIFAQNNDFADADALYISRNKNVVVTGNKFTEHYRAIIRVNNKRGEKYGDLNIWTNMHSKLKDVSVITKDIDGNTLIEYEKDDFYKYCGYDNTSIYTDNCTYSLEVLAPHYPYLLEIEYNQEYSSLFYLSGFVFQKFIPVQSAEFEIELPAEQTINYKAYGGDLKPRISESEKFTKYRWTAMGLSKLEKIDYLPTGKRIPLNVNIMPCNFKFGSYSLSECDWHSIGNWYSDMAQDKYLDKVDDTSGIELSPNEALKHCYTNVIEAIRYVAISIGLGGYQPHDADLTKKRGFGDCKDMSTLLISELKQMGVEAFPVLVLTRSEGMIDTNFPNTGFNHLITMAIDNEDTLWMDPTCRNCGFGEVPYNDEDIDVLVITEKGGKLRHTPASKPDDNLSIRNIEIHIPSDLSPTISVKLTAQGHYGRALRSNLIAIDDKDKERVFIEKRFPGLNKLFNLKIGEIRNLHDLYKPVELEISGLAFKKIRKMKGKLYLDPFVFNKPSHFDRTDLKDRKYALNMYYPEKRIDSITVTYDSTLAVDSVLLPDESEITTQVTDFSLKATNTDDQIIIVVTKSNSTYEVPVEMFTEYDQYRNAIKEATKQYLKLCVTQ